MKRKIITASVLSIVVLALTSGISDVLSSGAPVGSTGAPGEQTCGKSGCHTGAEDAPNINTGAGQLNIAHNIGPWGYIPGQVYDFTVTLQESDVNRFGYSFTALDASNNKAGLLKVSDSTRTQILEGNLQYTGREYITYRMVGTTPYTQYMGLWTFQWQAPQQDIGKVNFFVAGVSANNDATDKGDLVYTYSLSAEPAVVSIGSHTAQEAQITLFPNPTSEYLDLKLNTNNSDPIQICIHNAEGKQVYRIDDQILTGNGKALRLNLPYLSDGTYILILKNKDLHITKKIDITH